MKAVGVTVARWLAVVLAGLGLLSAPVQAQPGATAHRFLLRSWQTGDGLPQNTVNAIAQSPDGYLWLGTQSGLARFDGVNFSTFGLRDGLASLDIRALVVTPEPGGQAYMVWMGTAEGLSRWREGRIEPLSWHPGEGAYPVERLAVDQQGRVWAGSERGLSVWDSRGVVAEPAAEAFGPLRTWC